MDDDERPRKEYPVSTAKMSKTPSWIMLGFVLGALFMSALPPRDKKAGAAPETLRVEITKPRVSADPKPLTIVEAVFAEWGKYATWFDDVTEVALWNSEDKAFSDFYEVRRVGNAVYFRTIPSLTRRILTHGKLMPESPLQFTETEEQYRDWVQHGRVERAVEQPSRPTAPSRIVPIDPSVRISRPTTTTPPPPLEKIALPIDGDASVPPSRR